MKDEPKGTLDQALEEMETSNMDYLNYDREILLNCFYKMFERLDFLNKYKNIRFTFKKGIGRQSHNIKPFIL